MPRKMKDYLLIAFKGMGMGAADVVPGVSGGTIAFITGIYEELINSIKSINGNAVKLLFQFKFKEFWQAINGNFLLALIFGIFLSFLSLAKLIKYFLAEQPILIWSFFFGLIVASAIVIARKITEWKLRTIIAMLIGIGIAYMVTVVTPAETPTSYWFLFLSGALAICAMILPGISGAFILLLLGKYEYILNAISSFKLDVVAVVGAGAVIGLLSFSNLLSWLLKKYHNMTIGLLSGFMIGSLNKVWPWKNTISTFIDRHGVEKPLLQENILPNTFTNILGQDSQLIFAILLAIAGFLLIWMMEKFSPESKTE
ncbi:polyprenyl-phosphate transporter [Labilibaculum euxinus]